MKKTKIFWISKSFSEDIILDSEPSEALTNAGRWIKVVEVIASTAHVEQDYSTPDNAALSGVPIETGVCPACATEFNLESFSRCKSVLVEDFKLLQKRFKTLNELMLSYSCGCIRSEFTDEELDRNAHD